MPVPTTREADRRLAELRATLDRMRDNLVELDDDVTRRTLDASTSLAGRTARRWASCRESAGRLWPAHLALETLWAEASALRGTRGSVPRAVLVRLGELLDGPSVALPAPPDPSGRRTITEGAVPLVQRTVDTVIGQMAGDYGQVTEVVGQVFAVWSTVVPVLDAAADELDRLGAVLPSGRGHGADRVDLARSTVADYRTLATDDPLGVPEDAVATVDAALDSARQAARDAVDAARRLDAALSAGAEGLAAARSALARYRAHREDPSARIAPGADDVALADRTVVELDELERELQAARLMAAGRPEDALRRASAVDARITELRGRVAGLDERGGDGVAARDELRGRLGALQAKAQAMGRIEDTELELLGRRAGAALYRAPCDLDEAAGLVEAYQQALRAVGRVS